MTSDPHAPYVKRLAEAGDWAALVRYWIAHDHEPAMEAAIGCVRRRAVAGAVHLKSLVAYLETAQAQALDFHDEAPDAILTRLPEWERLTLHLLWLYSRAMLCELALEAPPEDQTPLLAEGIKAAQQAAQVGVMAHDPAVTACFFDRMARGLYEARQLEAAKQAWAAALHRYRELAQARPKIYPPRVAMALSNLGTVQRDLNDLESARTSYKEALWMYRKLARTQPELYRPQLATMLSNLGSLQRDLNKLESARTSYKEALTIRREFAQTQPELYRPQLASTLNNLGTVQRDLNDLESAQASYKEALAIRREFAQTQPELYRPQFASTLNNLGNLQCDLNNLEMAWTCYQEALAIRREFAQTRPEVYRSDVAMTLNNLANVQRARNDLAPARASFEEGLGLYRELARAQSEVYRPLVAMTLNNLGNVQSDQNDLLAARASFEEGLGVYRELAQARPEVHRADVAMMLNNLGNAQRDLNDLVAARNSYGEALAIRRELALTRPKVYRALVARTLNNQGIVQHELKELKAARTSYQEALAIRRRLARTRPEVHRPDVAMTLNNLGTLLSDLNRLESAQARYEEALGVYRGLAQAQPEVYRQQVATTLNNLGTVRRDLRDMKAARASYEEALGIYRELTQERLEVYRPLVATTLNNLDTVQEGLSELQEARTSYEEAARLYAEDAATRPAARLVERQRCWTNLGPLLRQESSRLGWPDYRAAYEALRQARHCAEHFRGCFADAAQRKRVQAESAEVYDLLARTCLDLWDVSCSEGRSEPEKLREAVEAAEAGRARQILDLLADELLTPNLPPKKHELAAGWPQIRRQFLQAGRWLRQEEEREARGDDGTRPGERGSMLPDRDNRRTVRGGMSERSLDSEVRNPASANKISAPTPAIPNLVAKARELFERRKREHDEALAAIREFDRNFNPDQPVVPVELAQVQKQIPTDVPTGLVQFTVDREGGFALIVMREQVRAVRLPELTEAWAQTHAKAWFKSHHARSKKASAGADPAQPGEDWGKVVTRRLEPLAARVVQSVVQGLAGLGLKRLVLAPHRALHVFPLHACETGEGRYLGDAFEILYTPSLSMWHRCACLQREAPEKVLLIQNPTRDRKLCFTDMEGAAVARRFQPNVRAYRGWAAQKEVLLEQGQSSQVWHYCGHARFDGDEPLRSALILGGMDEAAHGDKWLTLRDVFTRLHLPQNSLSVLNGCESGMLMPQAADDYVNLPTGFLYAGARCVISTLWAVNDLSSALLMEKFYALWRGDNGGKALAPAAALREAVRWLREDIRSGEQVARDLLPALLAEVPDPATRASCETTARELERRFPDCPPFASTAHWAPFICAGVGYSFPSVSAQTER